MRDLTSSQRDVLAAVNALAWARGYPPTVREIGEAAGLSSTSTVHHHVVNLTKHGFLRRMDGQSGRRSINLSPRLAGSRGGVLALVVPVTRCETCRRDMPADHVCTSEAT